MTTKILALTLAVLPALAGARDLGPGTFELGGGTDLGFGSATTEVNGVEVVDISTRSVNADALYYVVNNLGIGLGISYDWTEFDDGVSPKQSSSTSIIGPELKLNLPIAPKASVLLGGAIGRMVLSQDDGFGQADADGFAFLLGGGVRFFPADFVSLDALLNYTKAGVSDDAGNDIDVSGWELGLGVSVYFGGR